MEADNWMKADKSMWADIVKEIETEVGTGAGIVRPFEGQKLSYFE